VENDVARLTDNDLPGYLSGYFRHAGGPKAFVFTDADYFPDFRDAARRALGASFRDLLRRVSSEALCIFVSSKTSYNQFFPAEGDRRDVLSSIRDQFFLEDGSARSNIVFVGSPDEAEVQAYQRRLRLQRRVATDFDAIDANVRYVTSQIRSGAAYRSRNGGSDGGIRVCGLKENQAYLTDYAWGQEPDMRTGIDKMAALHGRSEVADRLRKRIDYAKREIDRAEAQAPETAPEKFVARVVPARQRAAPVSLTPLTLPTIRRV